MEWRINDTLICKVGNYRNFNIGDKMVIQTLLKYEENIIIINGYWFYKYPNSMNIKTNIWLDDCFTNISALIRLRKDKLNEINKV